MSPTLDRGEFVKTIALLMSIVLLFEGTIWASPGFPGSPEQASESKQAIKAKAEVHKRGVGEQSRVRVELRDGREIRGYISKIEDASFEVTDKASAKATMISYSDVSKVKGPGLSKAANILIAVGIAVGIVVAVLIAVTPST